MSFGHDALIVSVTSEDERRLPRLPTAMKSTVQPRSDRLPTGLSVLVDNQNCSLHRDSCDRTATERQPDAG
jgi:hypothetical protein